jgi:hypothetical protein
MAEVTVESPDVAAVGAADAVSGDSTDGAARCSPDALADDDAAM